MNYCHGWEVLQTKEGHCKSQSIMKASETTRRTGGWGMPSKRTHVRRKDWRYYLRSHRLIRMSSVLFENKIKKTGKQRRRKNAAMEHKPDIWCGRHLINGFNIASLLLPPFFFLSYNCIGLLVFFLLSICICSFFSSSSFVIYIYFLFQGMFVISHT